MPVEHEHPLTGVARDPHQDPLHVTCGPAARECHLDRAVTWSRAMPGLRREVNA
jgi:hypothetical protein